MERHRTQLLVIKRLGTVEAVYKEVYDSRSVLINERRYRLLLIQGKVRYSIEEVQVQIRFARVGSRGLSRVEGGEPDWRV